MNRGKTFLLRRVFQGMSVDIADDAELSQAERDALADLSQGFQ
ncbi:hypothetical protein L541_4420, partial [Bordetella hinzii CA90 BAL1384]